MLTFISTAWKFLKIVLQSTEIVIMKNYILFTTEIVIMKN